MAPYTFTIDVENKSNQTIYLHEASTLGNLDGETNYDKPWGDKDSAIAPNGTQKIKITKSGGTDGLFSALTWATIRTAQSAYGDYPEMWPRFMLWCKMPAAPFTDASVQMAPIENFGVPNPLNSDARAKLAYDNDHSSDWVHWNNVLDFEGGFRCTLEPSTLGFPDSSAKIVITSYVVTTTASFEGGT